MRSVVTQLNLVFNHRAVILLTFSLSQLWPHGLVSYTASNLTKDVSVLVDMSASTQLKVIQFNYVTASTNALFARTADWKGHCNKLKESPWKIVLKQ